MFSAYDLCVGSWRGNRHEQRKREGVLGSTALCWRLVVRFVGALFGKPLYYVVFHPLHSLVGFRNVASCLYLYCYLESLRCCEDAKRALLFQDS